MLSFFFLIGFATVISWLLLCFFPLLCGSYFVGDGVKLPSKQRIDDGHGCFPAMVRLLVRKHGTLEASMCRCFIPLNPWKCWVPQIHETWCQRLMYYTCAMQIRDVGNFSCNVVSNPMKLQVPPWHQSLRFVNCWIDGMRPLRVCCGWNSWSVQKGISTRWYPTVSQFAKLVYNSYNLGLW